MNTYLIVIQFFITFPYFTDSETESFWKGYGKSSNQHFYLSHNIFLSFHTKTRNHHFRNINFVVYKCFSFGLGQNFVVKVCQERLDSWDEKKKNKSYPIFKRRGILILAKKCTQSKFWVRKIEIETERPGIKPKDQRTFRQCF